jgi:hypothetical protein
MGWASRCHANMGFAENTRQYTTIHIGYPSEITAAKVLFPDGLPGLKRDASPAIPVIA